MYVENGRYCIFAEKNSEIKGKNDFLRLVLYNTSNKVQKNVKTRL